jgi:hypothetical protein
MQRQKIPWANLPFGNGGSVGGHTGFWPGSIDHHRSYSHHIARSHPSLSRYLSIALKDFQGAAP